MLSDHLSFSLVTKVMIGDNPCTSLAVRWIRNQIYYGRPYVGCRF